MIALKGKGFFISDINAIIGGNSDQIVSLADKSHSSFIIIKIADGINPSNSVPRQGMLTRLVTALKARNILTWGWQYIYGNQPEQEALIAIDQVDQYGLDGLVVFTGRDFQVQNGAMNATKYMAVLRQGLAGKPIAFSANKFPASRKAFPWQPFLEKCDMVMPQVFWTNAHGNSSELLLRSFEEYKQLALETPFCPILPTFKTWGWVPYAEEVRAIQTTARELQLTAIGYYSLDSAVQVLLQDVWQEIQADPYLLAGIPTRLQDELVATLNARNLNGLLSLYNSDAVLLNDKKVLRGSHQIERYFQEIFETMPSLKVSIGNQSIEADAVHLEWQADGNQAIQSEQINAQLKLVESRISTHYQVADPSRSN